MADLYANLATDYHWLFSDKIVGGSPNLGATSPGNQPLLEDVISTMAPRASILDCSCGIGADAIALRNRGFTVTASDGSQSMTAEAKSRVARYAPDIEVVQSEWEELPNKVGGPFDLVICLGNSIVHSETGPRMVRALQGIRKVLRPKGTLVVDSRNWELLYKSQPRVVPAQQVIERSGQRCCSLYVWSIPDSFSTPCRAEIILLFEDTKRQVTYRRYVLDFHPLAHDNLVGAMRAAGFSITHDSFQPETSFYAVVGEAT